MKIYWNLPEISPGYPENLEIW